MDRTDSPSVACVSRTVSRPRLASGKLVAGTIRAMSRSYADPGGTRSGADEEDDRSPCCGGSPTAHLAGQQRRARWLCPESARQARAQAAVDLGCGPSGILGLLATAVSPSGRVIGVARRRWRTWPRGQCPVRRRGSRSVPVLLGRGAPAHRPARRPAFDLVHARTLLADRTVACRGRSGNDPAGQAGCAGSPAAEPRRRARRVPRAPLPECAIGSSSCSAVASASGAGSADRAGRLAGRCAWRGRSRASLGGAQQPAQLGAAAPAGWPPPYPLTAWRTARRSS